MIVKKAYARAGVDVDLANKLKRGIGAFVKQTHGPQVLGKVGGFGGLFRATFPGMRDPVLVASMDGVGTKLKIAFAMDKHDTVGVDLVNHCVDDIAVLGARPLFFLDYIGCERLEPRVFQQLLRGLSRACRGAGCALLGGETAQMPGMYRKGEYDLAGCIVGVVDRTKIIDGSKIKPGDAVLGFAEELKIPFAHAFVRNHYIGRAFLQPTQLIRDFDVRVKLNLIKEMVAGKRVVVVDDSIVRGTTARARVVNLREAGAKEVHIRVSCPPHRFACHYGIDFPDPEKLIANQMSMEDICKYLGVDSLGYLDVEGMVRATGKPVNEFCLACFTGNYPLPVDPALDKFIMEKRENRAKALAEEEV